MHRFGRTHDTQETYLRAILATVARETFAPARLVELIGATAGEKQHRAYNLCDGTRTQAEIAKELGLDQSNFSKTLTRWVEDGIVVRVGEKREARPLHVCPLPREPDEEGAEGVTDADGVAALATKLDTLIRLQAALAVRNMATQREKVVFLYAAGLGPTQIAALLGTTAKTVGVAMAKHRKPRSTKQLASALEIDGSAQVIQNALDHLAKHGLIVRLENDGQVKDGSRWVYVRDAQVRANRRLVERYADDPAAAKKVATKRRPTIEGSFSLSKPADRRAPARLRERHRRWQHARLKIMILVTNPSRAGPLQTMVEGRYIEEAIQASTKRDKVDRQYLLAPTLSSTMDALNRARPDVIHFSGHGGGEALLFDNDRAGENGGTVLDFETIARLIAATSASPKLMVLAACDTLIGVDRFIAEVPAVVAMAASIDDVTACEFSRRFYQSLCDGTTIAQALEQAKLLLKSKGFSDSDLPTLTVRDDAVSNRTLI